MPSAASCRRCDASSRSGAFRPTCGRAASRARSLSLRAGSSLGQLSARSADRLAPVCESDIASCDCRGARARSPRPAAARFCMSRCRARSVPARAGAAHRAAVRARRSLDPRCWDRRTPPRAASHRPPAASAAPPGRDQVDCARARASRAAARLLRPDRPAARWLVAAALAHLSGQRLLALPLGFLLLPPRQLAQLLHERVHLLIGLLLLRALRGLVLIRQLVEVLLEQIREIAPRSSRRRRLRRPAPPLCWLTCFSYSSSAFCSCCSARFSGGSALFAACACSFFSAAFISSAAFGSSSAIFWNAGSGSTSRLFMRPTRPSTCSRSFAATTPTTTRFSRSFCRRHRLVVADDVVRGRDDLALLLRERVHLHLPAPPPPPPPPPPIDIADRNCSSNLRMRMK